MVFVVVLVVVTELGGVGDVADLGELGASLGCFCLTGAQEVITWMILVVPVVVVMLVAIILLLVDFYTFTNILAIRNRTDKQLNEEGDGVADADSERKKQRHSDSMKKKCPECPISFVFQVKH